MWAHRDLWFMAVRKYFMRAWVLSVWGDHMGYSEAVEVADECQTKGKSRAAPGVKTEYKLN